MRLQLLDGTRPLEGQTQDISDSGIQLVAGAPIPPGSAVSLQLLCSDREVRMKGEVIWSRRLGPSKAQSGIQFRPPPDPGFAIQLFIREFI